jgi:hypothetical protein
LSALKRMIKVETLSRSAKALLPRMNAGTPTTNRAAFQPTKSEGDGCFVSGHDFSRAVKGANKSGLKRLRENLVRSPSLVEPSALAEGSNASALRKRVGLWLCALALASKIQG